jgi:hypothetical protein
MAATQGLLPPRGRIQYSAGSAVLILLQVSNGRIHQLCLALPTWKQVRKNGRQFNAEPVLGGKLVRAAVLADLAQSGHVMGGQHHDGDCGKTAAKHLGGFQTAHARHLKVHEHQIGLQLAHSDECLVGIAGDPHDFNVGVIFKKGTERPYKRG